MSVSQDTLRDEVEPYLLRREFGRRLPAGVSAPLATAVPDSGGVYIVPAFVGLGLLAQQLVEQLAHPDLEEERQARALVADQARA